MARRREILACPFCGGRASVQDCTGDDGKTFYWVEHHNDGCPIVLGEGYAEKTFGMETNYFRTAAAAINSWNRRV